MGNKRQRLKAMAEKRARPEIAQSEPKAQGIMDAFVNAVARMGAGQPNLLNGTTYQSQRMTRNQQLLTSLYREHWIVKKIVNAKADDMVKNWFELASDITPESIDRFNKLSAKTQIKAKITEALYWARLYGGAACIMLIDAHGDQLDTPLDIDTVMPNAFKGLLVVDRWSGIFPDSELVTDISDPEFGLPKYYLVTDSTDNEMVKIHHSRILRVTGRKLPFWENQMEMQWGASEIEHVYDELVKRDNTSYNIASLVFMANLRVVKSAAFNGGALAIMDEQTRADIRNMYQSQNELMNNNSMQIIAAEDEFQSLQYTFTGLNDIYESFMLDIAGASEYPVTRLFGRSPGGLNSTGDSDQDNYYDTVSSEQETKLRPLIEKLLPVMFMSEFGVVPDDIGFKFNPLNTPTDDEKSDLAGKKVTAITDAFTCGLITKKMGLKELKQMSYTTGMFSNITDEDIEAAVEDLFDESLLGGDADESESEISTTA